MTEDTVFYTGYGIGWTGVAGYLAHIPGSVGVYILGLVLCAIIIAIDYRRFVLAFIEINAGL